MISTETLPTDGKKLGVGHVTLAPDTKASVRIDAPKRHWMLVIAEGADERETVMFMRPSWAALSGEIERMRGH
jgi:hypothetical protein